MPSIFAPIWVSIAARSMISGSRAALSITVVPSASTAAMRMFSVAPTLGKSSQICAPRSTLAAARRPGRARSPWWRPARCRPDWCMSSGREPMASPPGSGTTAPTAPRHQRAEHAHRGPQPRHRAVVRLGAELARARRSPRCRAPRSTPQPRPRSTSAISGTSRISGQLVSVVVPSASSAAAISLSTLFLAPTTSHRAREPGSAGHHEMLCHDGRRYLLAARRATVPPWPCT